MERIIDYTARLIEAGRKAYKKKRSFFGVFALVFLGSTFMLAKLDLLPEMRSTPAIAATTAPAVTESKPVIVSELPMKIEIDKIGLVATIANPETTNVEVLDKGLLKGAVRYPTSAKLGEAGNVVLFGHSSYLPVVGNQAYKTFNGIQKLVAGDVITVYSADTAYTYRVRDVSKESAASDAGINLAVTNRVLTLATCDSFGKKSDRFVVTADFVESNSVSA